MFLLNIDHLGFKHCHKFTFPIYRYINQLNRSFTNLLCIIPNKKNLNWKSTARALATLRLTHAASTTFDKCVRSQQFENISDLQELQNDHRYSIKKRNVLKTKRTNLCHDFVPTGRILCIHRMTGIRGRMRSTRI